MKENRGGAADDFESKIPIGILPVLSDVCAQAGVDPLASTESEEFFLSLLENRPNSPQELREWLTGRVGQAFRYVSSPPQWIQNPEWPFADGKPMVFVGQIDVPARAGLFHDEARFYVFWDPERGTSKTVIQVA